MREAPNDSFLSQGPKAHELDNMADGEQNAASKSNEATLTERLAACEERLTQIKVFYRNKKLINSQMSPLVKVQVKCHRGDQEIYHT